MQEEAKRFQPYPQGGSGSHDPSSGGGGVINGSDKTGGSNETGGEPPGTGPDQQQSQSQPGPEKRESFY